MLLGGLALTVLAFNQAISILDLPPFLAPTHEKLPQADKPPSNSQSQRAQEPAASPPLRPGTTPSPSPSAKEQPDQPSTPKAPPAPAQSPAQTPSRSQPVEETPQPSLKAVPPRENKLMEQMKKMRF
jgi:hypothetical protein